MCERLSGNHILSDQGNQTNSIINVLTAGNMILKWITNNIPEWVKGKMVGKQWSAIITFNYPVPSGNIYIQTIPSEKQLIKDPICKFKSNWKGTCEPTRTSRFKTGCVCCTCMCPFVCVCCSFRVRQSIILATDFCKESSHCLCGLRAVEGIRCTGLIWNSFCVCLFLGHNFKRFLDWCLNNF